MTGGGATWNLKDSWTAYVGGAGTITPALTGGKSVYSPASGTVDPSSGVGTVRFGDRRTTTPTAARWTSRSPTFSSRSPRPRRASSPRTSRRRPGRRSTSRSPPSP
ncbi:hypothetical protein NKG05_09245 [Oerskovia sp. M15]